MKQECQLETLRWIRAQSQQAQDEYDRFVMYAQQRLQRMSAGTLCKNDHEYDKIMEAMERAKVLQRKVKSWKDMANLVENGSVTHEHGKEMKGTVKAMHPCGQAFVSTDVSANGEDHPATAAGTAAESIASIKGNGCKIDDHGKDLNVQMDVDDDSEYEEAWYPSGSGTQQQQQQQQPQHHTGHENPLDMNFGRATMRLILTHTVGNNKELDDDEYGKIYDINIPPQYRHLVDAPLQGCGDGDGGVVAGTVIQTKLGLASQPNEMSETSLQPTSREMGSEKVATTAAAGAAAAAKAAAVAATATNKDVKPRWADIS